METSLKKIRKKQEAFFGKDLKLLRNAFFEPNSYKHFQKGLEIYQKLHFICLKSKLKKEVFKNFCFEIKAGLEILNLNEKEILEAKDFLEIAVLWAKLKPYRKEAKNWYREALKAEQYNLPLNSDKNQINREKEKANKKALKIKLKKEKQKLLEEQKKMDKPFEVSVKLEDGSTKKEKRVIEKLMARRKVKKEYHYEVKWKGKTMDENAWYPREMLEKRGFLKWMKALDARLSASQAMGKPLTARNVEEHLGNVGLESEHATHSRIRDLSGGQKVKVVLAACTWSCPHVIILDEPTNYLDRDSLGALKKAIDNFEGGVCLITHNKEFADATTRVTWVVANNKLDIKGDAEWEKYAAEQELIQQEQGDTMTDAMGNTVKIKKIKKVEEMSRAEIKKNKKLIKSKIKNGEDLEEHEQDWADEWNIDF
mgnify:CR=1 FL=1